MKRKNWPYVLLILVCIGVFFGYKTLDRMQTDTTPPQIVIDDQIPEISVQDPQSALIQGIKAIDKVDGDVTDSLVVESVSLLDSDGTLLVTYTAFDSAGNVAKVQRDAKFTDYKSPRFTMKGPLAYPYSSNFDILSTVGATDVVDGDIQHRVRATALEEESIATLGTHYVQFRVSNSLGDTVSEIFPVEVYSADQYDASLTLKRYLLYSTPGANIDLKSFLDTFTLRGEAVDLSSGLPENYTLRTKGDNQLQYAGVHAVEFRVTYTEPNELNPELSREYTAYSKLIVVVEG